MRRITSILMVMMLCNIFVYAQYKKGDVAGSELPIETVVKIGKAQGKLVPDKWYFLHSPRNPNQAAVDFVGVGKYPVSAGGLVTDRGVGNNVGVTQMGFINTLKTSEGVFANNILASMVRFVPVEDNVFNIQFGTGNWMADSPANGTVNNNNYIAGNAGKYNFYLVTIGGVPNAAGRFAWNKYNMAKPVDNNGAGNNVVFWAEGETTGESEGWATDADIKGNKIWQIYDIEIVEVLDKYGTAFQCLLSDFDVFVTKDNGTFIGQLQTNINEGDLPGNYRAKDVEAFLTIHNTISELKADFMSNGIDAVKTKYPSIDDIKVLNENYIVAYNTMIENRIQRAITNIKPGYYIFCSPAEWSSNRIIALCSRQATLNNGKIVDALAWGTFKEDLKFLWKVESVEGKPSEYRMINMANGKTHVRLGQSTNSILEKNDTATVCFDWRSDSAIDANGNKVVSFNIRSSSQPEDDYYYLHCEGHQSGKGTGSWVIGWSDSNYTRWYMSPINYEKFVASGVGEVDGINYWFSYNNEAFVLKKESQEYSGQIIIPESVVHNGFSYNVVGIDDSAFYGCSGLTSVTIPNSVTSIVDYAFSNCNLSSLTIEAGVFYISPNQDDNEPIKVFWLSNTPPDGHTHLEGKINYVPNDQYSCYNRKVYPYLNSMFEVNNMKYVPVSPAERTCELLDCVYDCIDSLVNIAKTVSYKGIPMTVENVGEFAFYGHKDIKEVYVSASLLDCAFKGCSSLAKVSMGDNVKTIGGAAFSDCSSLTKVSMSDNVKAIGEYAFKGCSFSDIKIGTNVKTIGRYAFSSCYSLSAIAIPQATDTIGYGAFSSCTSLTKVAIEDRTTNLVFGGDVFYDCPLDSVYIGGKFVYSSSPFSKNESLRCVTFANNVDSIYSRMFYECPTLKSVTMGAAIVSIGAQAFSGCRSLGSFTFPSAMKAIGDNAFSGCSSMTSLISLAPTPPTCGNMALDDIDKWSCVLKVPESSISAYKAAGGWKEFFFIESLSTAITEVTEDKNLRNGTDIYTIGGMKVTSSGTLPKGVYIVDGKKVIVD